MTSRTTLTTACALAAALLFPGPAAGQAGPVAAGTVLGAAGGTCLSIALTTAAARAGHYAFTPSQAIWRATPIPVAAVAGAVLGHQGADRLRDGVYFGLAGLAAGTLLGAAIGSHAWEGSEGVWSGAIVGGGVGLLAGSVWGALRGHLGNDDRGEPAILAFTFPAPFSP